MTGGNVLTQNSTFNGAWTLTSCNSEADHCTITGAITTAGTTNLDVTFCEIVTGATAPFNHGSSGTVTLNANFFNTTNATPLGGAGTYSLGVNTYPKLTTVNVQAPLTFTAFQARKTIAGSNFHTLYSANDTGVVNARKYSLNNYGVDGRYIIQAFNDADVFQRNIISFYHNGNVTKSSTSSFYAYSTADAGNVTGDATAYTVVLGAELFDQNSNFGTNTFTAPVTGKYYFEGSVLLSGIVGTHSKATLSVATTARTYRIAHLDPHQIADPATELELAGNCYVPMTAGDTATLTVTVSNGTKVISVLRGDTNNQATHFAGTLIN